MRADRRWVSYTLFFCAGVVTAIFISRFLPVTARETALETQISRPKASPPRARSNQPWGTLEPLRIPLAEASEIFSDRELRLAPPRWFFQDMSESQVIDLVKSADLTEAQRLELTTKSSWLVASNGLSASPSPSLVRELSPLARQQIYSVLARSSQNYPQLFPFRFRFGTFSSVFASSGVSSEKLDLIKNLTYTNSGDSCLADIELLPEILTRDELDRFIDCLYRVPSYRLRLRVFPDSDIDALIKYWCRNGNERRVRPMLESLTKARGEEGATIGVGFFFPPFARLRLNTFPDAWNEPQVSKEDCFWTSMNFFSDRPDMRFLDGAYARKVLAEEYSPISDDPRFGDLVTLINTNGDGLHMCVYIADNFVFTKNGMNTLAPWVLMSIPDMLLFFPSETEHRMVIFRRKVRVDVTGQTLPDTRAQNPPP